jgi:hypothetical protein
MSRLLQDAVFLETKLDNLGGANSFGAHVVRIVKAKELLRPPEAKSSASQNAGTNP